MSNGLFLPVQDGLVTPTEHARGPWDPQALHGGAVAALITRAFELAEPEGQLRLARLAFEFLRPIPFAELEVITRTIRAGRRVRELAAELRAGEDPSPIGRASALAIQSVPGSLPDPDSRRAQPGPEPVRAMAGPEQGRRVRFALDDPAATSLATTGMEMSWLTDDPWSIGPGQVWMRLRRPVVAGGEQPTALQRLVATADFGNGISAELPFGEYLFINADLTIHLWRSPEGEWIGLDAKTVLMDGGIGTAESVVHDQHGPVGRAVQTLVVQPR